MAIDLSGRHAFDLTALADELDRRQKNGDRRYEKYRIAIEEFEAAASILRDLRSCERSMQLLAEVQSDEGMRQAFGQPLFTHAVLSYCRALVSETNARRRINVDDKAYDQSLREKHLAIKNLRSTALAHYHIGKGKFGNIWTDDRVAVRPVNGSMSSIDIFLGTNYLGAAANDLLLLLATAIPYVWKERLRRQHALDVLIANAMQSDTQFVSRMESHKFDPTTYFPTEDSQTRFWTNESGGGEHYCLAAEQL
ncbi:hypothetical protein ACWKW9_02020 [Rhizobium daejeonense]